MQVNSFTKTVLRVVMVAIAYALTIYNDGYLATISLAPVVAMLLFVGYDNGLAMLLAGISGLIGQLIRFDFSLLFESFAIFAAFGLINSLLNSTKLNKYIVIALSSVSYLVICLLLAMISFGYLACLAIIKVKLIEFVITLVLGLVSKYLMIRLEKR